jgi:hypothetical protein
MEVSGSRFYVLRAQTHFRRYRGHRVPFSCFGLPSSFSTVRMASAPGHVFGGAEYVGSRFHVLRAQTCFHVLPSRTHFQRYRGRRVPFSYFVLPDSFSAVPRASDPFSCFARPDSFSTVPMASGPVFMFCAPEIHSRGTEGVRCCFHVLHARTHFRRYRGCRVPFSCFALTD